MTNQNFEELTDNKLIMELLHNFNHNKDVNELREIKNKIENELSKKILYIHNQKIKEQENNTLFLESFLGQNNSLEKVEKLSNMVNSMISKFNTEFHFTTDSLITNINKNDYFFTAISQLILDNDAESLLDQDILPSEKQESLNLDFTQTQYENVCDVTKKRIKKTVSFDIVKKIVCSDIDLFFSSYSGAIDDTYSRGLLLDLIEETLDLD